MPAAARQPRAFPPPEDYSREMAALDRKPPRHYAWDALRLLYVEGEQGEADGSIHFPAVAEIAKRYGLNATRIRERAAKERWTDARAAYQENLEVLRREAKGRDQIAKIVETDDRALATASLGATLVLNRVREIEVEAAARARAKAEWERIRDTARAAVGEAESSGDDDEAAAIRERSAAEMAEVDYDPWAPPVVDAKELSTLAQAAANWHTLALKALGEGEIRRIEVSGPGGAPVQVQAATIYQELTRDDPARLHGLMGAFGRAIFGIADEPLALVADPDDGADPGDGPGDAA